MSEELEYYQQRSIYLCDKLLNELRGNEEDAADFFGGEIYRTYSRAMDMAQDKTRRIRNKIRNL